MTIHKLLNQMPLSCHLGDFATHFPRSQKSNRAAPMGGVDTKVCP
jgi:hypothetical protein|tara:strand:- start:2165 stop:2299 length:135 start_codon:yes stop_codon:yes gene_type:complete